MNKLLVILILMAFTIINAHKPRIWLRIPPFFVKERVYNFIQTNMINNCFEFQETHTNLLLKCWRNNKIVDVNINIMDKYNNNRFVTTISI